MKALTRQPRDGRYLILVDGEIEGTDGQKTEAVKRAAGIAATWIHWRAVEVFDSWTGEMFWNRFRIG